MIDTSEWAWEPASGIGTGFWVGLDPTGRKWLIKMRGSFYAIRERVFGRLANRLGLRCQEAEFLVLPFDSPPLAGEAATDPYQVALRLMTAHEGGPCGEGCPVGTRLVNDLDTVLDPAAMLADCGLQGATGWLMADFLSDIFGANEGSERFLTADHECTLVDNEQHFSVPSTWQGQSWWLRRRDGSPSVVGEDVLLDLCDAVARLTAADLSSLLEVPRDFTVSENWPLFPILQRGVDVAARIAQQGRSDLRRHQTTEN